MELKILTQYQVTMSGAEYELIEKQMRKTAGNRKESIEDRKVAEEILDALNGWAQYEPNEENAIRETDPEALEEQYGRQENDDD